MSKRITTRETIGDKIDETLAENVNDLFGNGMNEDQFGALSKEESNPRRENKQTNMGYNITTSSICRKKNADYTKGHSQNFYSTSEYCQ